LAPEWRAAGAVRDAAAADVAAAQPRDDDARLMKPAWDDATRMERAAAGERLASSELAMFDRLARLDSITLRNMSGNSLAISATVIIGIVVTGSVGYAQNWIRHHNGGGRKGGHPKAQAVVETMM
jgi:hypothetical protein